MRKRRLIIVGSALVTAVAGWFLCVDWSWFLRSCPHCGCIKHVFQYRVLGIPVHESTSEEQTLIQWMAADLAVACQHPELKLFHKHRRWGLCYCAAPCINGLWNIDGGGSRKESWYDEATVRRLCALAEREPRFATEFHQRVIRGNDWDYLRVIIKQIMSPELLRTLEAAEASGPPEQEK